MPRAHPREPRHARGINRWRAWCGKSRTPGSEGSCTEKARVHPPGTRDLAVQLTLPRAAGHLHYVHVACTEFLTAMHTGDRTKEAIDAGGVLPGYAGTIVRDGYKGYEHLTDA